MQKSKFKTTTQNSKLKTFYFLLALFAFNFSFLTFAPQASAHILETDNTIGAVLHIDPNDEPIAGQQASFFFEFKDKQGKFNSQTCDCNFTILQHGKQIFTQPLFETNTNPSITSANIYFTFPTKDVYKIKITGNPINPDTFQPFTINYDIRVNENDSPQPSTRNWFFEHIMQIAIGLTIIIVIGAITLRTRSKRKEVHEA